MDLGSLDSIDYRPTGARRRCQRRAPLVRDAGRSVADHRDVAAATCSARDSTSGSDADASCCLVSLVTTSGCHTADTPAHEVGPAGHRRAAAASILDAAGQCRGASAGQFIPGRSHGRPRRLRGLSARGRDPRDPDAGGK